MFNKIHNPITGNWVNTNGTLGKQILHNYINQTGGSRKRPSHSSRARAASKRRSRRKAARRKQQATPKLEIPRLCRCGGPPAASHEPASIASFGLDTMPRSPPTPRSVRESYNKSVPLRVAKARDIFARLGADLAVKRAETAARNASEHSRVRRRYHALLKDKSQKRRKSKCTRYRKH